MSLKLHHAIAAIVRHAALTAIAAVTVLMVSCSKQGTPRPEGYFRIDNYPACYHTDTIGRVTLQVNDSARSIVPPQPSGNASWLNIAYPRYRATIYLSYIPLSHNLEQLMAESIELVYRQNINTDRVEAIAYEDSEAQLFATLYTLSAQSATPVQFIATDSIHYLLRGALYFDTPVKADSVAPSLEYIENDIMHMIESITYMTP